MTYLFFDDIITLKIAHFHAIFHKYLPNIDIMNNFPYYELNHDKADGVEFFRGDDLDTRPHFHRCIELLYITEGSVDCKINDQSFRCGQDEIMFVHKCGIHSLVPAPSYANFVLIIGQQYSSDFSGIFQNRTLPAHLADRQFNRTLLAHFLALDKQKNAPALVKKGYIDIIVGSLLDHYERVPATPTPNIAVIVAALNYIDGHYREPISLDSISSVFGYNKYYFSRLFNTYIGESLNAYINAVRVRNLVAEARQCENPDLTELVFAHGFNSMTTFYRNFSKYYSQPPTEVFRIK